MARIEVVAWLLFAVPMLDFVLAPNRVRAPVSGLEAAQRGVGHWAEVATAAASGENGRRRRPRGAAQEATKPARR